MKKIILIVLLVISLFLSFKAHEKEYYTIPKDSIRFRIIPNSNTVEDLTMKEKVKTSIYDTIEKIEKESTDITSSRKSIQESISTINNKITTLFKENNYDKTFNINYGLNYFPEKTYKGVKYESGYYESMVVEIGEKQGDNYWCVLFPPLCLIDTEDTSKKEYTFFVKEIINRIKAS